MKRINLFFIALAICVMLFAQSPQSFNLDPYNPEYDPHTVLVKFKDEAQLNNSFAKTSTQSGITAIDGIMSKYDIESVDKVFKNAIPSFAKRTFIDPNGEEHTIPNLDKIYKIKYKADIDPKDLVEELKLEPSLDYAEPDYYVYMALAPDDPFYQSGDQWHIDAVNAPAAWDSTTSDTSQIISIIDTGVDWDHPDLDDNIWVNKAESTGVPGVDDDGNGYIDDIRGWDFINDDNDPNDDNSHGTHVAGIAAAESNNGVGITGIAWNARIMPIKVLQSSGRGNSSDFAAGIDYAAQNGATVINMSLGSYGESYTVKTALENAYAYAVLVAAAGNDALKLIQEGKPFGNMYPACYGFVIGVEASTISNIRATFSNIDPSGPVEIWNQWGNNYEIKAPGVGIYSTFPNGNYKAISGTSMASPIVAGAVALMKSFNPVQSTEQVFAKLIQSANSGLLDIKNALDYKLEPDLVYMDYTLVDTLPGCDGDGIADAGETVEIYFTVKNAGGYADSVWSKLRFGEFEDTTAATILDSTSYIGDISAYASLTGELDHIILHISEDVVHNRDICFKYDITPSNSDNKITGDLMLNIENGVELSGVVIENDTLSSKNKYLINDSFVVGSGAVLYIEPGTHIEIGNRDNLVRIDGKVIAIGEPDSKIIITSKNDIYTYGFISSNQNYSSIYKYCEFNNISPAIRYAQNVENCIFNNSGIEHVKNLKNNYFYGLIDDRDVLSNYGTDSITNNVFSSLKQIGMDFNSSNSIKYNIFSSVDFIGGVGTDGYNEEYFSTNSFINCGKGAIGIYGDEYLINIKGGFFGGKNVEEILNNLFTDFKENSWLPMAVFDSTLELPPKKTHGVVWKVDINGNNPFDEKLDIIGTERLKYDVYFNRAMDTTKTPFLTFGVREPYTQKVVVDNASWSSDSTVWTAYYDVGLETGDGIQRVRVANAQDDEHFEIPIEDSRFEFVIQAAGAASIAFNGTPGIGKVDLEWPSAETDDILGYNMYRAMRVNDSTWTDTTMINTSLVTDTLYTDFNVIPDTTYRYLYTIIGTDMAESDFSKAIAATPFSAANGDANGDLAVNVLDIISIVSYMLEDDPSPFLFDAADLNGDDVINVLDIIGVISIIINDGVGKQAYADATESIFSIKDNKIMASSNGAIGGYQFMINGDIEDLNISSEYSMEVVTKELEEDKMLVMVYSLTGQTIPEGNHAILNLSTTEDITFSDLIVADSKGQSVSSQFGDGGELIPEEFKLEQNYPNPFNATTTIAYQLPQASDVSMKIYNLLGQTVYTQNITDQRAGYYHYTWQGMDNYGHGLPSGLYIYQIKANEFADSKKMILLK